MPSLRPGVNCLPYFPLLRIIHFANYEGKGRLLRTIPEGFNLT